ncbi:uncharacterized protein LOC144411659 [Styela clava]
MEEKLIALVEEYPCLYNTTQDSYRRKDFKGNAWAEIAREMGMPWQECENKWKNLRDKYRREKKKRAELKSGAAASHRVEWSLMRSLEFLEPFTAMRSTTSNLPMPDTPSSSGVDVTLEAVSADETDQFQPPVAKKRKSSRDDLSAVLEKLQQSSEKIQEDPDELFLLSMAHEVKTMSVEKRWRFKVGSHESH